MCLAAALIVLMEGCQILTFKRRPFWHRHTSLKPNGPAIPLFVKKAGLSVLALGMIKSIFLVSRFLMSLFLIKSPEICISCKTKSKIKEMLKLKVKI